MSDDIKDEYERLKNELRPHWEALVRAAHERGLFVTGFVYCDRDPNMEGPLLIRFGNVWGESPAEMFMIHWQLAQMAATAEQAGIMNREITPLDPSDELARPSGLKAPTPLEIADSLVLSLLAVPVEMMPDNVNEILKAYTESRKPEGK